MWHTVFRPVTESPRYRVNVTYLNKVKWSRPPGPVLHRVD